MYGTIVADLMAAGFYTVTRLQSSFGTMSR